MSFATTIYVNCRPCAPLVEASETRKFFYFSEPVVSIAGFCRYFHDLTFLPFGPNSPFRPFMNWPLANCASVNGAVNDRIGRSSHRSQHNGTFANVKSQAGIFVDNKGLILSQAAGRSSHRSQHNGTFANVKSQAGIFVDNKGLILSQIRDSMLASGKFREIVDRLRGSERRIRVRGVTKKEPS